MSDQAWKSIGGVTRAQFPLAGKDWTGPEKVEAIIDDATDRIKALRGLFTRPHGTKCLAIVRHLKATTKHTFQQVPQ